MTKLLKLRNWALLASFLLLFFLDTTIGCIIGFTVISLTLATERSLLKMLTNWGFLVFVVIVLSVPLFVDFSVKSLMVNLLILLRGIIFIFLIYLAVRDIQSSIFYKKIKKFLPEELIKIIEISFKILPNIKNKSKESIQELKEQKKSIFDRLVGLFDAFAVFAENLALELEKEFQPDVFIVTGKKHEGKTTLAYNLAQEAINNGSRVGGILSLSINEDGKRAGYAVLDLKSGKTTPLASTKPFDDYAEACGPYYFYKEGFDFAYAALDVDYIDDREIVFIDEVGWIELMNKGFSKNIKELLNFKINTLILVVRDEFVEDVEKKFIFKAKTIFRVQPEGSHDSSSLKERFMALTSS